MFLRYSPLVTEGFQSTTNVRIFSVGFGLVTSAWVSLGISVQVLLVLMAVDMICGVMVASQKGQLSSRCALAGVTKKAAVLIVLIVTYLLQYLAEHQLGAGFALPVHIGAAVAIAYCIIESISIVENCHSLGAPIPELLSQALKKAGEAVETQPRTVEEKE